MLRDLLTEVSKCILGPRRCSWHGVKRFVFCCGRFAFMSVDKDNLEEPLHVYYRALGAKRVEYAGINIGASAEPPVQLVCTCSLQAGGPFPSRKGITTGSGAQSGHLKRFNWLVAHILAAVRHPAHLQGHSKYMRMVPYGSRHLVTSGWRNPAITLENVYSKKDNSVEILLKILQMQPFPYFSDVWLASG